MKHLFRIMLLLTSVSGYAQPAFETDPLKAKFITSDIPHFWEAFDRMDSEKNPFTDYLKEGSAGLKDFIKYRIESPKNLLKTVRQRKADYERIRSGSYKIDSLTGQIREYYVNLKTLYEEAVFPVTYFVIGAFNSGGTSTDNGLIIGVEMQTNIENIPYIVAHELIHFNQHYPRKKFTLLEQSVMEGSADFIGELISGKHLDDPAFNYGNAHEEQLCSEFVEIMDDDSYHGWLYGTKGKKKGRPNDLGYWMGYKICESYYNKSNNKKQAVSDMLNINDFKKFLAKSGYLSKYVHN